MHRMTRELTDEQYDALEELVDEGERELTFDELSDTIGYLHLRSVERWPGVTRQGILDTVKTLVRNAERW